MGCRGGVRLPLVRRLCVVVLLCAPCLCSVSVAKRTPRPAVKPPPPPAPAYPALPVRAVCLGGWLVTEGWILPPLFDGIPNKDLLDGTQVQFKSALRKTYITADQGGGGAVLANRTQASDWETFKLWRINETTFNFRTPGGQFVGIGASDGIIVATATAPALPETFQIVRCPFDKNRVRIKAANGYFVQAIATGEVIADYGEPTRWSDWDASVFLMTKVGQQLQGEYQLCNGYGADKAASVLRDHWNTYIVEDDFKFIASSRLTAVRIPVGWWIASDPNPPAPYVGGSLQALDNAFKWAEKYKLGVIIDLHAAPGSQNPWEHSSSRDGTQEWGTTDANIAQTVQVIEFLASRYAASPSLFAVELLNEPLAPRAALDSLTRYYRDGYDAVRRHSPAAYVVMSNRLSSGNSTELLRFAGELQGAVIDVHYYTVFNTAFSNFTVQQNIDFVRTNFSGELAAVTTQNGPLTFVGKQVQVALLLNYDPSGPSRLLPVIAEQEGTRLTAVDIQPFLDFVKRGNLQTEFFSIRTNQYLVTSIHENWFCARCVNSTKSGGEGAIVMQIGAYLLVSMYDGSLASASQAMVATDQFAVQFNRRTH